MKINKNTERQEGNIIGVLFSSALTGILSGIITGLLLALIIFYIRKPPVESSNFDSTMGDLMSEAISHGYARYETVTINDDLVKIFRWNKPKKLKSNTYVEKAYID